MAIATTPRPAATLAASVTVAATERPRRRRRTPEQAAAEILRAAEAVLSERSYHEATVTAVMARTTLSRKSFYVYFRDIPDVITHLVRPIQKEADDLLVEATREPQQFARISFLGTARIYARHGVMLRALYEASAHSEEARRVWLAYIEPAIGILTHAIRAGIEAGRFTGLDPEPTARALMGMNHRVFFEQLAGRPDADVEAVVAVLLRIWARVLYRKDPEEIGWLPAPG